MVILDHLLASCQSYIGHDTDPISETSSSNLVIPGKILTFFIFLCNIIIGVLTHNRAPVHTEKFTIPEGLLEALDWQDERSIDVGLTIQGQKMLVIGGFPFVKALVG